MEPSRGTEDSDTSDEAYRDATRMRESVDERFSGYLLALAAKQAEKQLRDQEAAAFPSTNYHETVAHYVNRSDSEEADEPTVNQKHRQRKDSGDETLKEMRKHGEKVFKKNQAHGKTAAFNCEFDAQPVKQDVWQHAGGQFGPPRNTPPRDLIGGKQQDPGLKQMRKAASPPMLGGDMDFPRCPSPDHARFDVTQGADFLRNYLSGGSQEPSSGKLWGQKPQNKEAAPQKSSGQGIWGGQQQQGAKSPEPKPKKGGAGGGLWGGHCNAATNEKPPEGPTGLITPISTPRAEKDDPMATLFQPTSSISSNKTSYTNLTTMGNGPVPARPNSPPSPPPSIGSPKQQHLAPPSSDLDARLALESKINAEFSDAFVTQVYNYLSLGYPSLARKFDDELSHISKYPVDELREDDKLAEARGYVRLGEDEVDDGVEEGMCKRWRALRRYVREWGRQMLRKEVEGGTWGVEPQRAWGLPARRGSWGL